jgi:hypothetical protein
MVAGLSPNQDLIIHTIGVYILENSIPRPVGKSADVIWWKNINREEKKGDYGR